LIFEEKWSIDAENGLSEMFAKTTLKKSEKILNLLKEQSFDMEYYINLISEKIKIFINERKRELKLLEKLILNNRTLRQKIGKKQFLTTSKNYIEKLNQIENYFNSLNDELKNINKIKEQAKYAVFGTYDLRKGKDRIRLQEDYQKEQELKRQYKEKLKSFLSKIKKAIKRIIFAIQEKMMYLIETKYITTKKIIFKAHYKKGKFWYLTKIYDKNYVGVVNVFDENIKESLLSS